MFTEQLYLHSFSEQKMGEEFSNERKLLNDSITRPTAAIFYVGQGLVQWLELI